MMSQLKNKKKFTVIPQSIQFKQEHHSHKFTIKNTSLRTDSYQVINPNQQHYHIETERKFNLAPGMSQICHVTHLKCEKCHKDQFNKLRITSSDKESLLVTLQCPQVIVEEVKLIETIKSINLEEFNFDVQKQITFPVKNLSNNNLKLSMSVQSNCPDAFTLQFQEKQIILLQQRTVTVKGKLNFVSGCEFKIRIIISITSQENLTQVTKVQKITLTGNALVKNQTVKNSSGKVIDSLSLKVLNGTSLHGQFILDNNFRKDCTFKLIPEISSTNPNQFSSKWQQSEIIFSQDTGDIKAFEMKKISYEIKTCPNQNDINFIEKFSKIDFNDEFNLARMKSSKYFKKNVDINVKAIFIEKQVDQCQNVSSFKVRLNIINPALKIRYKSLMNKEVFDIYNESELVVPFEIENNSLFKVSTSKGVFEEDKNTLEFEWKMSSRPQSAISTFCLAYGKCNLFLKLPQYHLQIYNFTERENLRPSTSTIKKNLGLQKSQSTMLKRPLSALCNQMVAKKLMLVRDEDFYPQIPRFLALDYLKNQDLQKVIVSSSQKGNIISNTWNKQVSIYFPNKGHLILKPLKAYLLPYKLQLHSFFMNDQQFYLSHAFTEALTKSVMRYNNSSEETYTLSTRELTFAFNPNKKEYEVENSVVIKNSSKQTFKAFLLTVEDECFFSGEEDNKVVVHPNESVSFRIKLIPTNFGKKESKITKKLEFLINGKKDSITCYGELLPVDCDYSPKELKFTQCHYGEEQTSQMIMLTNVGFSKLSYQVYSPQYVSINHLQMSGTIAGKGHAMIVVRFKPSTYLQKYKDHIKILIRGSHAIFIPVYIDTKKPDIAILENSIDFGEGIFGDVLETQITLENRNKTTSQLRFDLRETELKFDDHTQQRSMTLKSNQTRKLTLNTKVTEIGTIRKKVSKTIATIPGFGSIQSPLSYGYVGKQNILDISPNGSYQSIAVDEIQSSFKIKLRSLIGQKVHLRAQLIPEKKFDQTFIMSIEPQGGFELTPYCEKEISVNSLISDLQKLKEIERNYSLLIYRKGHQKPYTSFKFNVKLPTPKLIIEPKQLYFPITGLNVWNHINFKIENKGYKEIHFRIKKPSNIAFDLDVIPKFSSNITSNLPNENKLTKLNNEAEVRVSFRAKTQLNFQNILIIEDNFGNSYQVKIYGLATNCPLLLSHATGSMPISSKSIPSAGSMSGTRSITTMSSTTGTEYENEDHQIQHAKFLNYWIGSFMPHMKKENSFHQYLSKPQTLMEFLDYFSISFPKVNGQKMRLSDIIFELRKLDIPLDIVNVEMLSQNVLSEWIKFMYIFLSKKFLHPETLKWLSKVSGQAIDNYEVAHNNYKKIILNTLNNIFSKVFNTKIIEYEKIVERFDPFMEFLFKIESRKHLILSLNILYHKLSAIESQTVKSEEFNHKLLICHNPKYEKTINWIISSGLPEFLSNSGGTNIHLNISECGYYFSLDKTHSESEVLMGLKENGCIAILNSTLFEKCYFVQYELLEIQPKIHNVVIECEDKFCQEWILDYEAPVDSQYKIDFIGDPQFKCRYSNLGITKMGKRIPITITYSPNNLNTHTGTLTIMNKHFKEIYSIRGKALYSQNIEYERQVKMYQGKRHIEVIEIPWECPGNTTDRNSKKQNADKKGDKAQKGQNDVPILTLVEYNEKRKEFLSHNISIVKHNKKQCMVKIKLQYLFEEPIKNLPLFYQITNEDQTQSKIIRVFVRVIPKPVHIEAEIKCKLQQSVTEKIPLQNLSEEKEVVSIEFSKGTKDRYKHEKINSISQQESERTTQGNFNQSSARVQNQFKVNKRGKTYLEPGQLDHIHLTYRPDSLFETSCEIKVTYEESQSVVHYKFKGIPQFPSSLHETIKIQCLVEQKKTFTIPLKSLVRESTTFEVQTNIKQLSGKDKVVLGSGQTLQYVVQTFSHHPGKLEGEIIFKSPEVTFVYPVEIEVLQNSSLAKNYRINSRIRHATVLQLQLHNKSKEDIEYQVFCNHEYLTCPQKFFIQKESKKVLEATYQPYSVGEFEAQVKFYHPDLKEIVYDLSMRAQEHQQIVCGPELQLLQPYVFVLTIKNPTSKNCLIDRPELPVDLKFKSDDLRFPLQLNAGKTYKMELLYLQKNLCNSFDEVIEIKTDCIGDYKFRCQVNLLETKTMESVNVHYQNGKSGGKLDIPFKTNFFNGFNQTLNLNLQYRGTYNKIINSLKLKSSAQMMIQAMQSTPIEGQITVNLPSKGQKSMMNIGSSQDLQSPLDLILWTMKNKTRFEFIYPIKLIKIYENPHAITVRANAYELQKTLVNLAVVRDVSNWMVENLSQDFVKGSFGFNSVHSCENYLETVINKPFKYDGFIIFYNLKNQAERVPLKIDIGEPKYETVVISSNVGEKAVVQIQLKNGKGPFKVQLTNNKTEEFGVEPTVGEFLQEKGESVAKINFFYLPNDYSGLKRAKVAINSQQGCFYFNLMGKFKSYKKPVEKKVNE